MNFDPASRRDSDRWLLRLAALVLAALLFSLVLTAGRVAHYGALQQLHQADAIVVFGAAEYSGRPSPVLRARLDHAFDLFRLGIAPVVITTGGAAADPTFSEGGVGRDYLIRRGVPAKNLIAEMQGSDTAESSERVAVIMRANGLHSCVAVSDAYHMFRIKKLLEREGIAPVYVSPRPGSRPHSAVQRMYAAVREAGSYWAWKMGVN